MTPLLYLRKQLEFQSKEWTDLPDEYKTWYKNAAREEMEALGIPVK